MDARRFSTEPWMASRKIAMALSWRDCSYPGKGPFLLVTFLWALAKKSDSLAQRVKAAHSSDAHLQARYNHPFCRASRYASIRLPTPSLPIASDR